MKFTCDKSAFAREISFAQEIISSRNALSIMSNVYIEAADGYLVIRATDIKVGFETKIPVEVIEPGSITVFCEKLFGILSSIPEGDFELEQDDCKVIIKPHFKKVKFQLKTISSEKYPELPKASDDIFFSVPCKDLKEMIEQTFFAVSDDETRYFMNGVYLEKHDNGLTMVATDGRRLSLSKKRLDSIPEFKGVIIPPKLLGVFLKRAPIEGLVDIAVTDKNIYLRFGPYYLSTVLIEGQFPNYQKVIPESQKHSVTIKRQDLIEALKRVSIFVEQKSRRTYFTLNSGAMVIASEESDLGIAKEEIPAQYDGEEILIALNCKYIEEPLKVMECEYISIDFSEPNRAITIRPEPSSDFFHIVMPMQFE